MPAPMRLKAVLRRSRSQRAIQADEYSPGNGISALGIPLERNHDLRADSVPNFCFLSSSVTAIAASHWWRSGR